MEMPGWDIWRIRTVSGRRRRGISADTGRVGQRARLGARACARQGRRQRRRTPLSCAGAPPARITPIASSLRLRAGTRSRCGRSPPRAQRPRRPRLGGRQTSSHGRGKRGERSEEWVPAEALAVTEMWGRPVVMASEKYESVFNECRARSVQVVLGSRARRRCQVASFRLRPGERAAWVEVDITDAEMRRWRRQAAEPAGPSTFASP